MLEQEVTGACKLPEEKVDAKAATSTPQPQKDSSSKPSIDISKTVTPGFSWAKVTKGDSNPVSEEPVSAEPEQAINDEDFPTLAAAAAIGGYDDEDEEDVDSDANSMDEKGDEDLHADEMRELQTSVEALSVEPAAPAPCEPTEPQEKPCSCPCDESNPIHVELSEGPEIVVTKKKKDKVASSKEPKENRTSAIMKTSFMNADKLSKEMRDADDGSGWVNSTNFGVKAASDLWSESTTVLSKKQRKANTKKKNAQPEEPTVKEEDVKVAIFTTDFSMQNVLMQLGLFVVSAQGMLVRTVKKWVLRCMACYTIQGEDMSRLFCSLCGASHLSRVAASIDLKGKLQLHLRKNYKVDTMGMQYSLPAPGKQGRFEGELLLREDQLLSGIWRQKVVKINKDVKSAFGEDVTSDVGIQMNKHDMIKVGLGKSNPNAQKGRERRGKKKKN